MKAVVGENVRQGGRFKSIDGLRGIAAMGVVLYHLSANLKEELSQVLPAFLTTLCSYGYLGVPIFFVISGLVISLSIGDRQISSSYALKFIVRRSIRLDPTYWAAIAFGVGLLFIKNKIASGNEPIPSFSNILAHMFYLQDILEVRPLISVVFWTLCLEIQFYLFYLFSLWFSQKISDDNRFHYVQVALISVLGVYSISLDRGLSAISISGLFISNWHYFLIGVLIANVFRDKTYSKKIFFSWVLIECASCFYFGVKPYQVAGISVGVLLYILWDRSLLDSVFTSPLLQYLGKISYTLYLVHPDIGWKVISTMRMIFHGHIPSHYVVVILILSILVSIGVAHVFHILFERPSLYFAEKLKNINFGRKSI